MSHFGAAFKTVGKHPGTTGLTEIRPKRANSSENSKRNILLREIRPKNKPEPSMPKILNPPPSAIQILSKSTKKTTIAPKMLQHHQPVQQKREIPFPQPPAMMAMPSMLSAFMFNQRMNAMFQGHHGTKDHAALSKKRRSSKSKLRRNNSKNGHNIQGAEGEMNALQDGQDYRSISPDSERPYSKKKSNPDVSPLQPISASNQTDSKKCTAENKNNTADSPTGPQLVTVDDTLQAAESLIFLQRTHKEQGIAAKTTTKKEEIAIQQETSSNEQRTTGAKQSPTLDDGTDIITVGWKKPPCSELNSAANADEVGENCAPVQEERSGKKNIFLKLVAEEEEEALPQMVMHNKHKAYLI